MLIQLEIGETAEFSMIASDADMASALGDGSGDRFPEVFATSRMVAIMELAAARIMKKLLSPDQLSVGVGVNIMHLAATPNHTEVSAKATFLGMEGKLYKFKIEAFDTGGLIGKGEHTRAIIEFDRLVASATKRVDGNFIYHVVMPDYWQQFEGKSAYTPPTFAEEGFIHCCTKAQIDYVLSTYFKGVTEVLLLKIDRNLLASELKVEPANGQYFPHIYGTINKSAIIAVEKRNP